MWCYRIVWCVVVMNKKTGLKIYLGLVLLADFVLLYEWLFEDDIESLVFIILLTFGFWLYVLTESIIQIKGEKE